ncbi:MAG TPA: hypothetical protein VF407_13565 [Polyangiaceae bacterium]
MSALALAACSHDKEEAGALAHSIEVYRGASDSDKQAAVEKIAAVGCTSAEICDTKDECLKMARPTAEALAIKLQARKTLDLVEKEAGVEADVKALPDRLDEASRLLDEGHEHLQSCQEKLTGLEIKYRL